LGYNRLMRRALSLLVVVACGSTPVVDALPFEPASANAAPMPSQPGPFPVGVRTIEIFDTGRPKPDGSPRRLLTEVWYPATQDTRGQPTVSYDLKSYFTPEQQAQLASLPLLQTTAVRDAKVATGHGPFPLVVFSHGQAAVRFQSTYYTVLLASHGYIVVAADHEGGTLADVARGTLQNVLVGVETRPQDVRYLINKFSRLDPSDDLAKVIDLEHIGVTGHSFGALTALRVAALDARVKAIVPQAPFDATAVWSDLPQPVRLGIPVEVQGAHRDQTLPWDPHVTATWGALLRPRWLLDVSTGGHFTFSDLCAFDLASIAERVKLMIPGADVRGILADGCGPPAPVAAVAQPLITHFAIGFFNATLRGSTGSYALLTQAHADALAGTGVGVLTADP
jgi:predicted dienelactone hydrolase